MTRGASIAGALAALAMLSGCAVHNEASWSPAQPTRPTPMTVKLEQLPPAGDRVAIAVYNFTDQTGQFKPTDGVQTLSRAVTQGATSILVKALQEAGNRSWFTVIERERLDNLLRERAVIREMRSAYLGEKNLNRTALPPLLFAGVLLEGGIIGYDSNTKSGGLGARFLGIGASTQYREDTVTVYLRAVSVKTGEVLSTVSVRKTIASFGLDANSFRYVAFKDLLEVEAGIAYNEPDALALQQAIETAVYGMVMEGATSNLWCIATTPAASEAMLRAYYAQRDNIDAAAVQLGRQADGTPITGACPARQAMLTRVKPARPLFGTTAPIATPMAATLAPTTGSTTPLRSNMAAAATGTSAPPPLRTSTAATTQPAAPATAMAMSASPRAVPTAAMPTRAPAASAPSSPQPKPTTPAAPRIIVPNLGG